MPLDVHTQSHIIRNIQPTKVCKPALLIQAYNTNAMLTQLFVLFPYACILFKSSRYAAKYALHT